MLTDRQEKIKQEIEDLLLTSSSADIGERQYLRKALNLLEKKADFKKTINGLIIDLYIRVNYYKSPLTPRVNEFFKSLIVAYGEPDVNEIKPDWRIEDPNYIFMGSRIGWRKRVPDSKNSKFSFLRPWLQALFVLLVILLFWISPAPSFLVENFGDKGKALSVAITLIILVIGLSFSGRFKKKK